MWHIVSETFAGFQDTGPSEVLFIAVQELSRLLSTMANLQLFVLLKSVKQITKATITHVFTFGPLHPRLSNVEQAFNLTL